ncbi:MAG: dihydroorotase [Deltaproteobacteria bacterium]
MAGANGKTLISGGRVIDPANGRDDKFDVLIDQGLIAAVDRPGSIPGDGAGRVDASGMWVTPGFVDMHVHLREPGYEYKETIASGCRSAVAGGVTSVACMANTNPVNDNGAVTQLILARARAAGLARVYPIGALSVGLEGEHLAEFGEMYEAGIVAVSDDGRPVMNSGLMRRALEYARMFGFPVIAHEEDLCLSEGGVMNEGFTSMRLGLSGIPAAGEAAMVGRDIELARYTGGRLHLAHLSTAQSVELVRRAKDEGLEVSAEAAPHHFILDETAADGYNTNAKMYPPLRTAKDVEAIRAGLADGAIDTIATDHAPHHHDEKVGEFDRAAFGIVGLETMLPLTMTLVREGILSAERMVDAMSTAPARNLGLEAGTLSVGVAADLTVLDPEAEWRLEPAALESKSKNTPFGGWGLKGRVERTMVGGRTVWEAA